MSVSLEHLSLKHILTKKFKILFFLNLCFKSKSELLLYHDYYEMQLYKIDYIMIKIKNTHTE